MCVKATFDRPATCGHRARVIAVDAERVSAGLPSGYRARAFADSDREAIVAERNASVHPMEQLDAEEWRMWDRIAPDETLYRIVVEDTSGRLSGFVSLGAGSMMPQTDGAQFANVNVWRADRQKGLGSALLRHVEEEAARRGAPRVLGSASAAHPDALAWVQQRGYREIGRRIESFIELARFDPEAWQDRVRAAVSAGTALRTFAEVLEGLHDAARERFYRALYEAERPMWEDIPFASPTEHWPYERFRKLAFESGRLIADASVIAYDGDQIVGFTMTGKRQKHDGDTWLTGTSRTHRGRGIATAMKVEALRRAKAKGLRAMITTNDEPNKAMRGINARLGYEMLPARVQFEKKL